MAPFGTLKLYTEIVVKTGQGRQQRKVSCIYTERGLSEDEAVARYSDISANNPAVQMSFATWQQDRRYL